MKNINIAIDGPSSSGKSTISKILAKKLNKKFISTGLIYRAIAYSCITKKINLDSVKEISNLVGSLIMKFNLDGDILVNGKILTTVLRTEEVSSGAAKIAAIPEVRNKLMSIQKNIGLEGNVIMEGRDIGTVILPKAGLKIFLICSLEIRAKRRTEENLERGIECSFEEILKNIGQRDYIDINREFSPLKPADDAITLDSSYKTVEEITDEIISYIK